MLIADRTLIEQILINLIKNACEAIELDKKDFSKINVNAYKNNSNTIITVADNGAGISKDAIGRIFIPFFTTKPNGSGIGLSLCKQIMNLHRGSISVASAENEGTKSSLRFPI
jgi:Signal transduction histidine kinase regulating C4-dicarboxylate transport system